MKKVITLLLLSMLLTAQESVTQLKLEQVSRVIDSTFSEETVKTQGKTEIEDDAFVDNVQVLQKPSVDEETPGNLILNSSVTSNESEIHQGLTNVKSGAKLQDSQLESVNEIKSLEANSGASFVSQGNVIIGDDSNVSHIVNSANENLVEDGTADKLTVLQHNSLEDTEIKNTTIHQGLIVITNGADVSNLNVTQQNSIKRSDMSGQGEINATQVTQGQIKIEESMGRSITQNVQNEIDNLMIDDSSSVNQAYLHASKSDLNNMNEQLNNSNTQDIVKNEMNNVEMENALINQDVLFIDNSSINRINKYNRGSGLQQNNLIHSTMLENNATINQSTITIQEGSTVTDLEYFTAKNPRNDQDAINEIKVVELGQDTVLYQDRLELNNATLEESSLHRTNSIKNVNISNESNVYQFYTQLTDSEMQDSKLSDKSYLKDVSINDSAIVQGMTTVK
ncbi:MAG: Autotransporter adhesin [uncultured Sulfurovum sp.]|uniref:Autotransporter adhesin n=1 Tax=uncultured Sulfurovum sp. TaxID=269237 RepID=A0A6S6T1Y4_9BACT|nr:MAG: Autotransporter adhesin [uncultured Sulfurovum sp.]